jgi:hypothetical protein
VWKRRKVATEACGCERHHREIARPAVDQRFVLALRRLARSHRPLSSAEAWRLLAHVSARIGVPRPSYSTVRDIYFHERCAEEQRIEDLDAMIRDFTRGYYGLPTILRF